MTTDAFVPVHITAAVDEGLRYRCLTVGAGDTPLAGSYRIAGQQVALRAAGLAPLFLPIATAPFEGDDWELLIPRRGELGRITSGFEPGDVIELSPPRGIGFDLGRARERELVLCCHGSAIAAMRGVLHELVVDRPSFGPITLLYGEVSRDEMAWTREHGVWEGAGIRVDGVASGTDPFLEFDETHVQGVLRLRERRWDGALALLAGSDPMIAACRTELLERGVAAEDVWLSR